MPGYVTDTAIVSIGRIGIRKPRITRGRKTPLGSLKGTAITALRQRNRPSRQPSPKSGLNQRSPPLICQ